MLRIVTQRHRGELTATAHAGCAIFGMTLRTFEHSASCHAGYGVSIVTIRTGGRIFMTPRRRAAPVTAFCSVASGGLMWAYGCRPGGRIVVTSVTGRG